MTGEVDHRSGLPRLAAVSVVFALGVLAGCGQHTTAGQAAPQVKAALTQVENAVAAHEYTLAQGALNVLTQQTVVAQRSGTLSAEQADRILAAAARVRSDLPLATPVPSTTASEERGGGQGNDHKMEHKGKHD